MTERQIELIKTKSMVVKLIRDFFDSRGFTEVDTPILVKSPDPSLYHEVFETKSLTGESLYLIPSPEFFIKRLISEGIRDVYQITKCFRDSPEKDPLHRREFTMIEWYRDDADYTDLMTDCADMTKHIYKSNSSLVPLPPSPWPRIACKEAFKKYAEVDLDDFTNIENARKICIQKGYNGNTATWEQMYHLIFLNEVEPMLLTIPGFFLYNYPAQLAELSQINKDNPKYAERFEWYLNGFEIGNGYSELTDWREQEKRLIDEVAGRKLNKMKSFDYDHGLVDALRKGLPKTAGIAVGIDRLVMALTNERDIENIIPYNL